MISRGPFALSIDPGVRGCGCAMWTEGGRLVAAGYARSGARDGAGPGECARSAEAVQDWALKVAFKAEGYGINRLILEWPQVYSRGGAKTKGDPNDLLPLAAIDGALAAIFPSALVTHYTPHEWKQSVKKPDSVDKPYIITSRVLGRLDAAEKSVVEMPTAVRLTWDVVDAIGVGLNFYGRFSPRKVFPRE